MTSLWLVDAFTDAPFKGNPAGVCHLTGPVPDHWMQSLAAEMNQAETAFLKQAEEKGARVVVLDIPLLFETGGESRVDATVVVSAPHKIQRARVLERGVSLEQLEALLARQMPDAEKRRRADFVVDSAQGVEHARTQVRQILVAVAKMPSRRK